MNAARCHGAGSVIAAARLSDTSGSSRASHAWRLSAIHFVLALLAIHMGGNRVPSPTSGSRTPRRLLCWPTLPSARRPGPVLAVAAANLAANVVLRGNVLMSASFWLRWRCCRWPWRCTSAREAKAVPCCSSPSPWCSARSWWWRRRPRDTAGSARGADHRARSRHPGAAAAGRGRPRKPARAAVGLAITRRIADTLGAAVELQSQRGHGTQISVRLRRAGSGR